MTSAFIIQVQPELQPDPNEETAALLRVLIHKIDNTTFGANTPTVPQWSGPPHAIIQVQAMLYASLAASLFSAFLAMLGKQWVNRYISIDMRGSAIERSQNRQRKLDGIITWYFHHVMESLPLMLQFALLLLGCALSRYLWEIDTTVASVVLGVTALGLVSYTFFIVAGTVSASCPYQTPGAHFLRHILPLVLSTLRSASSPSKFVELLTCWWDALKKSRSSIRSIVEVSVVTLLLPITLLMYLVIDAYCFARAIVRVFVANALRAHGLDPQTVALDQRCILWVLQTSLDKNIYLPTLSSLATVTTLADLDPALVSACFDILAGCVSIVGGKVAILQGSEELIAVSALCCLRILPHLITVDPASNIFEDMRQRYTKSFPIEADFSGLPSYHHFSIIHNIFHPSPKQVRSQNSSFQEFHRPKIQWKDHKLSSAEHAVLNHLVVFEYQRNRCQKMPRWILRYGNNLLSQNSLPSAAIVTDCLLIVAMDLGCPTSNLATLDERYVRI